MDVITLLGVIAIVLAICALIGLVPGGLVAAIVLAVIGLVLLGGGLTGRRTRL